MCCSLFGKLDNYKDLGILMLRIGIGAMFIYHGYPKMFAGPQTWQGLGMAMGNFGIHFAPTLWGFMSAFAEFFGGIALVLGLLTRPMCVLLTFDMFVAVIMHFSKGDGMMVASHAIEAGIVFWSLVLIGPGSYSLDAKCVSKCCK